MKHSIRVINLHGKVSTISGTPVVVPGYEKYSFLFHSHEHMKGYGISEVTSGLQIIPHWEYCKNKAQAIEVVQRYLEKYHVGGSYDNIVQRYLDKVNGGKPLNEPLKVKKIKKTTIKQQNLFK